MMKKIKNLFKVAACLIACFMFVIGNPIKTEAGYWDCYFGHHNYEKTYVPSTCTSYGYTKLKCVDCGYNGGKIDLVYPSHCFDTNPYKVPTCIHCGYKKR